MLVCQSIFMIDTRNETTKSIQRTNDGEYGKSRTNYVFSTRKTAALRPHSILILLCTDPMASYKFSSSIARRADYYDSSSEFVHDFSMRNSRQARSKQRWCLLSCQRKYLCSIVLRIKREKCKELNSIFLRHSSKAIENTNAK